MATASSEPAAHIRQGRLSRAQIAERLDEYAALLEAQEADRFRVRAYRRGADAVRQLAEEPGEILRKSGLKGLTDLPGIGASIARAIDEMSETGRWLQLERLRGDTEPEKLFTVLPGIGAKTARLLHDRLHVDTLEGLEIAAHDGRLESISGIGARRAAAIRAALAHLLARRQRISRAEHEEPAVSLLLEIDREYRERANAGQLQRIAPRRFNPENRAWLPIMHAERDGWAFTALFSNTALAHELDRTGDWVVLYFHKDGGSEHQRTVVTETHGPLKGQRVVRGREAESERHNRRAAVGA